MIGKFEAYRRPTILLRPLIVSGVLRSPDTLVVKCQYVATLGKQYQYWFKRRHGFSRKIGKYGIVISIFAGISDLSAWESGKVRNYQN